MREKNRKLLEVMLYKLELNRSVRARIDARGLVFSRIRTFAVAAYVK